MRSIGLRGVVRGYKLRTTISDAFSPRSLYLVQHGFSATRPNQLWVAPFTYVATWAGCYVAFVIDVFFRMIIGWRVSRLLRSDLPLDALEQSLHVQPFRDGLIHHSDRGSQYL